MLKKLIQTIRSPLRRPRAVRTTPEVIGNNQHSLRRDQFSRNAVKVVEILQRAGYQAYVVGGCVRDQMLGIAPKDFDVATSATPEQVRAEFRNARIIGRRFKLVHVHFGREIIEVATFRAHHPEGQDDGDSRASSNESGRILRDNVYGSLEDDAQRRDFTINALYFDVTSERLLDYANGVHDIRKGQDDGDSRASSNESGRILRDNVYGSLEDDAQRRDFTINALYFDVTSERLLDYANGVHDIRNRLIRLIGDPEQRYLEDPVRMLRAVRFAAKLDFEIEKHSATPIRRLAPLLREIPSARLFDEVLKLFLAGRAERTFELLVEYELFAPLFPASAKALQANPDYTGKLIRQALANTDARIRQGKPVTPAFLFAALLWPALPARVAQLQEKGMPAIPAMQEAAHELISEQCQRIAIPKRFTLPIREIWDMQERLPRRQGKRADLLLENPRFRAGYDFLLLRESAGEETEGLGQWWTDYQEVSDSERRNMIRDLVSQEDGSAPRKRRRGGNSGRRRRGPRKEGSGGSGE
ncbi:polynucleotide adenylyltransferase PcnB [Pseudomonas aeruginosa]|uniref:polynucleotide adenylyltransferase PcnB n=1 Tax=Pseudomonas aeruginosa TaxID=287 RepID=UPI00345A69D1